MKKAFVLLRVSSAGQTKRAGSEEGYSLPAQREACHRRAAELEADVVDEFAAAESGSSDAFGTLKRMIAEVKRRGDIDYVIVHKLDRFARDELTDFAAYADLRAAGAALISVTENIDDTAQGMLLHGVLASINAFHSRNLVTEIEKGRVKKAKLGGTPYRAPLGLPQPAALGGQERYPHRRA